MHTLASLPKNCFGNECPVPDPASFKAGLDSYKTHADAGLLENIPPDRETIIAHVRDKMRSDDVRCCAAPLKERYNASLAFIAETIAESMEYLSHENKPDAGIETAAKQLAAAWALTMQAEPAARGDFIKWLAEQKGMVCDQAHALSGKGEQGLPLTSS